MFRGFDDDPFFKEFNTDMRQHHGDMMGLDGGDMFRNMDNMMNNMMRGFPTGMGMLEGPIGAGRSKNPKDRPSDRQVAERPSNSLFPDMGGMRQQIEEMSRDGNGHSFSSHQVYSYQKDGNNEPKEFQATSSTATAPGGVKETKKGYKDSASKTQKMQYGRYLGDKATVQERSQIRDQRGEKTDYRGFTEEKAPDFDREWETKAGNIYRPSFGRATDRNREIERSQKSKQQGLPSPKRNGK